MKVSKTAQAYRRQRPKFYECGICGAWHSLNWNGDCREDKARFNADDLDKQYGMTGWEVVEMPT